ncbi:MAG: Holliday junction resolvase RuvX [Chitinophagaceae bacterium]|nr:Holliday junction resolvase RuvX [Chitinophagaceae bacterium]
MARILCIDYGKKRSGIAVTDPLQIIATGLETIESSALIFWLKQYLKNEAVEKVLIGYPLNLDDSSTDATPLVDKFIRNFKKVFPELPINTVDERYSSKMASEAMLAMGMKKKERQVKGNLDVLSATIMLQEYLENQS